ncbi:cytochrome c oxidase subunit II [Caldithrix abyssi]
MNWFMNWLLPKGTSTVAAEVDALLQFIIVVSIILFIIVVGGTALFVVLYRKKKQEPVDFTKDLSHNTKLEIIWTVIPLILVTIVFFWGFKSYMKIRLAPGDAIEIKVTAQKWFWQFDYPDGVSNTNELVVPAGVPVKLVMSSQDVIHSFFVPNFRVKMDVLPNRYTVAWFEATENGVYDLFCAEYCGTGHSKMLGKVRVVSEPEYAAWLEENSSFGEGMSLAELGAKLYKSKACVTCHSVDGSPLVGPTFKGVFGHTVKLNDGSSVKADENYLRESILKPQAKVVEGFQPVMPTYQSILKPREVDALIEYIKSLGE